MESVERAVDELGSSWRSVFGAHASRRTAPTRSICGVLLQRNPEDSNVHDSEQLLRHERAQLAVQVARGRPTFRERSTHDQRVNADELAHGSARCSRETTHQSTHGSHLLNIDVCGCRPVSVPRRPPENVADVPEPAQVALGMCVMVELLIFEEGVQPPRRCLAC